MNTQTLEQRVTNLETHAYSTDVNTILLLILIIGLGCVTYFNTKRIQP